MNHKFSFIFVLITSTLIALPPATAHCQQANPELERQLRLARAEGIPTTQKEFEASLPKYKPSENAAKVYGQLPKDDHGLLKSETQIRKDLLANPTPENIKKVEKLLGQLKPWLTVMDRAVKYPHCLFPKDYSAGVSTVLLPEFARIKSGAKAKQIRATLLAVLGRDAEAIAELRTLSVVANHLREQPYEISHLVGDAVYNMRINSLTEIYFRFPKKAIYRQAIDMAGRETLKVDVFYASKYRLFDILTIIKLSQTKAGRRKLGIKDEYVKPENTLLTQLLPPKDEAIVKLVKAHRELFAEIKGKQRVETLREIDDKITNSMMPFLNASIIYEGLGPTSEVLIDWIYRPIIRKNWLTAFLRATESYPYAETIKTDDLINPYDGEPIKYQFDGSKMVFEWIEFDDELQRRKVFP